MLGLGKESSGMRSAKSAIRAVCCILGKFRADPFWLMRWRAAGLSPSRSFSFVRFDGVGRLVRPPARARIFGCVVQFPAGVQPGLCLFASSVLFLEEVSNEDTSRQIRVYVD
jgi:hypothetical protein